MNVKESGEKDKKKKRIGISKEIIGIAVASVLLTASILSILSYVAITRGMKSGMSTVIYNTCNIGRNFVDGDSLDEILSSNGESDSAVQAKEVLQKICDDIDFNYLYIIRPDLQNGKVLNVLSVHGSIYPDLKTYSVGQISNISADDYRNAYNRLLSGEGTFELVWRLNLPNEDETRDHVTGLMPIKDSSGTIVGIMCAEATFSWYRNSMRMYLRNFFGFLILPLLITIIALSLYMRRNFVTPFMNIKKETDRFADENTVADPPLTKSVHRRNELGELAESVNKMEEQTVQYISDLTRMTAERERLGAELDIAADIQKSALPHEYPAFPTRHEFELFAAMDPARAVGGDFYDYYLIDNDHLVLTIADVSGKGIPAALFMMESRLLIENYSFLHVDAAEILYRVNNALCRNNEANMFVTVWLGVLEISSGKLETVNAGHEVTLISRKNGSFDVFEEGKHGLALGIMEHIPYRKYESQLEPGDTLFIYTDGVPEATSTKDELFGMDRLTSALNETSKTADIRDIPDHVRKRLDAFTEGAEQFDDITMMAFRYLGAGN